MPIEWETIMGVRTRKRVFSVSSLCSITDFTRLMTASYAPSMQRLHFTYIHDSAVQSIGRLAFPTETNHFGPLKCEPPSTDQYDILN